MDLNDLAKLLESKKREINHYVQRKLPIKAGAKAKSIVQENFRLGGFQDGGLTLWAATRRQSAGYGADAKRGPLLSSRKVLYNGTGCVIFAVTAGFWGCFPGRV